jgi:hypothetical protein
LNNDYDGSRNYINQYINPRFNDYADDMWGVREQGLCFDDLGTEDMRSDYGNKRMIMTDILLGRDDSVTPNQTHIITNLWGSKIEEIYGTRVYSRIKGNFNIISFKEQCDMRK